MSVHVVLVCLVAAGLLLLAAAVLYLRNRWKVFDADRKRIEGFIERNSAILEAIKRERQLLNRETGKQPGVGPDNSLPGSAQGRTTKGFAIGRRPGFRRGGKSDRILDKDRAAEAKEAIAECHARKTLAQEQA